MARDVTRYVKGCSICAISSTPRRLPEGKLVPLPIPHRLWSHLGVDFATDLPPSNGFTTILIVVDRFSKSCKLTPLRGLPSALETAESLFQHIFRNFGLPEDIVSDRGPQFISRVWRGFLRLLGVSLTLSSGDVHAVDPGHQETPVGEGVMSRNNLHHHWNQPPTPAHNHLSTNHEHLQSLTTTLHKLTHLSHSSAGLKVTRLSTLVDVYLSARPS